MSPGSVAPSVGTPFRGMRSAAASPIAGLVVPNSPVCASDGLPTGGPVGPGVAGVAATLPSISVCLPSLAASPSADPGPGGPGHASAPVGAAADLVPPSSVPPAAAPGIVPTNLASALAPLAAGPVDPTQPPAPTARRSSRVCANPLAELNAPSASPDGEDELSGRSAPKKKKTKEAAASDSIANTRQAFKLGKDNFHKMVSDAAIVDLTAGTNKPGFLVGKLRTARGTASNLLQDPNLAATLEEEAKEQQALADAINVWKTIGIDTVRKRVETRFLESLRNLRQFRSLLLCAPHPVMFWEQRLLLRDQVAAARPPAETANHYHICHIKRQCPSLALSLSRNLPQAKRSVSLMGWMRHLPEQHFLVLWSKRLSLSIICSRLAGMITVSL